MRFGRSFPVPSRLYGVKRWITVITTQTQQGLSRITAQTTQTILGKSRITDTTNQTQQGKTRMTATTPKTQSGLSRVTATTNETQSGKGNIRNTTNQVQSGVGRIQQVDTQTQSGKGNIAKLTDQTIQGLTRITATTLQTITGKANIRNTTNQTQSGKGRIQVSTLKTNTGLSRITANTNQTQGGKSRITATTLQTQQGKGRIQRTAIGTVGFALQFDGSQNYLPLGTMGSFGSNLGSGFYAKFSIKTTSTALGEFGIGNTGGQVVIIGFNENETGSNVSGKLSLFIRDNGGTKTLRGATASATNFNDGNIHTIIITAIPSTNTITISIDGSSQTITYNGQTTPATFVNFPQSFEIGARIFNSVVGNFFACTLDNLAIGTSSSTLYGSYVMDEGSGSTTADSSGNGNTAMLTGSPLPQWVSGLSEIQGKARIGLVTPRTQSGKGRITANTTQTITGKARITATTQQAQSGRANIRVTAQQNQQGKSRITNTTTKTQLGKANVINNGTLQTQTGKASLLAITNRTQSGKGNIRNTTNQTQLGKSRIQQISGTRTNLIPNPSFEYDTLGADPPTGYTDFTTNGTIARSVANDAAFSGGQSWKISCSAGGGDAGMSTDPIPVLPNTPYTLSHYLKTNLSAGQAHIHVDIEDSGHGGIESFEMDSLSGVTDWTRISDTFTTPSNAAYITVYLTAGSFGDQFQGDVWYDALLLEQSDTLGNYFDGDTPGGSWTGTAGDSSSQIPMHILLGKARISATVNQTQSAKTRITAITNQTQTGKTRVQKTATQTQSGKARVQVSTTQAQTGKGRVTATTPRTQSGKTRVTATATQQTTGKSRVQQTANTTQTGKSRIQVQTQQVQLGKSRLTATTLQSQMGKSRITATPIQLQQGKSRVSAITQRVQSGKGNIANGTIRTIAGISSISRTTQQTQTGKASIKSAFGLYRRTGQLFVDGGKLFNLLSEEYYVN